MASFSFAEEFKSSIAPARLWKAAVVDVHNLLPKIVPQIIASMEIIEGDGGVGTVKLTKFAEAITSFTEVKSCTDAIDEANYYFKYSLMNPLYEVCSYEYKFEASADGGTLCKLSGDFKTVADFEPSEEQKNAMKDPLTKSVQGIEAYLQAVPDAYG